MRNQSERSVPDSVPEVARPIELVTENEFSILRLWEIDREPPPTAGNYTFLVRNPLSLERQITVEIADALIVDIELKTTRRIRSGNTYWICCAERHLATYVWENDCSPPDQRLRVECLTPRDINLANRWGTT